MDTLVSIQYMAKSRVVAEAEPQRHEREQPHHHLIGGGGRIVGIRRGLTLLHYPVGKELPAGYQGQNEPAVVMAGIDLQQGCTAAL